METNLRLFNTDSPITLCFSYNTTPLVQITKTGDVFYYRTIKEKLLSIKDRKKTDKFIVMWPGQWSSDVFILSEEDYKTILEKY